MNISFEKFRLFASISRFSQLSNLALKNANWFCWRPTNIVIICNTSEGVDQQWLLQHVIMCEKKNISNLVMKNCNGTSSFNWIEKYHRAATARWYQRAMMRKIAVKGHTFVNPFFSCFHCDSANETLACF